jgi:hypothetical protein
MTHAFPALPRGRIEVQSFLHHRTVLGFAI